MKRLLVCVALVACGGAAKVPGGMGEVPGDEIGEGIPGNGLEPSDPGSEEGVVDDSNGPELALGTEGVGSSDATQGDDEATQSDEGEVDAGTLGGDSDAGGSPTTDGGGASDGGTVTKYCGTPNHTPKECK